MSGELLKSKGALSLRRLYSNAYQFEYSNGWLDRLKSRYGASNCTFASVRVVQSTWYSLNKLITRPQAYN
uniref:HTH CENPB-type domain-containing protein n=1 Tax=Hyaloperonospora arabidopsidis (strain Emoy2) TaxID=559515 RepID=M4C3Y2_HYAAE